MTQLDTICCELLAGPATAPELVAITEMPRKHVSAYLGMLRQRGLTKTFGSLPNEDGQSVEIHELTTRGRGRAILLSRAEFLMHTVPVSRAPEQVSERLESPCLGVQNANKAHSGGSVARPCAVGAGGLEGILTETKSAFVRMTN